MAVAKKKAAPKKKAVVEKKTGEKYASKAMMAKHEKGESKKMRMMEVEIPMARKGGKMSCSCNGKGCMKCGGKTKKYSLGGALGKAIRATVIGKEVEKAMPRRTGYKVMSTPEKALAKSQSNNPISTKPKKTSLKTLEKSGSKALVKRTLELPSNATRSNNDFTIKTNEKGRVKTVLNKNKNVSYQAFSDGVVANRVRGDKYTEAMDTTGYSKGKKSFPMTIKKTKTLPGEMEAKKVTRFNVPREKVNSTIQGMKNRVLTAPAKKKTLSKSKPSFGKTLMRKGGKMC